VESIPQFHEVDRLQRFISARDNVAWRTFFFKGFNRWLPQNCARAPRTTELLRRLPLISTALFSIIDGGKHIPPHVGFFKSVLRDQTLPPLFRWLNRLMFRLLAGSRKLQQAARRAEAARDIRP
jgi:hypothetical protein